MPKLLNETITVFIMSAIPSDIRKTGRTRLNLTDKNSEKTSSELYIHTLGTIALKRKTATEGYKKNKLGKKT